MDIKKLVSKTKYFLLDMDGTIYFDDAPIGDMANTLKAVRRAGKNIVYFTNNSSKTPSEYVNKLKRIGLYEEGDFVYTSGMATAEYLNAFYKGKKVYLVGTDALKEDFISYGIDLSENEAEVCVLAYDTTLTFEKLRKINKFIAEGAVYIATHPDAVCPSKDVFPPDVGSFIALLKVSSGREPDAICGKPYTVMGDCIKRRLGADSSAITMVGDRLHTDIRFGINNSFNSLLVLSGETTEEMLESATDVPSAVLPSFNDIVKYL